MHESCLIRNGSGSSRILSLNLEMRFAFAVHRSPFNRAAGGGASGGAVQGVQRVAELPRTSARTGQKFGSLLEKRLIRSAGESGRRKS